MGQLKTDKAATQYNFSLYGLASIMYVFVEAGERFQVVVVWNAWFDIVAGIENNFGMCTIWTDKVCWS